MPPLSGDGGEEMVAVQKLHTSFESRTDILTFVYSINQSSLFLE